MTESLKHLAMRIRNELPEIEHTLKRAMEGVKRAKQTGDDSNLIYKFQGEGCSK